MLASIITVALAAVSGLTFIAYKHPAGYRKLHVPLISSVWAALIIRMIYTFGSQAGFYQALDGVRELNKDVKDVVFMKTPSYQTDPIWLPLLIVAIAGYLSFLRALPSILELPDRDR